MPDARDSIRASKPALKNGPLFYIRIAQSSIALIVLALAAYVLAKWGVYASAYGGLTIFTCIFCWWCSVYSIVFPRYAPLAHYTLIEIVLEFLHGVFWCASFASLAAWIVAFDIVLKRKKRDLASDILNSYGGDSNLYNGYPNYSSYVHASQTVWGCAKAVSGLGGLLFASCIGLFIYLVVVYIRERRALRELLNFNAPAPGAVEHGMPMADVKAPAVAVAPVPQYQEPNIYTQAPTAPGQVPAVYANPTQ